jgi:hypothetical protein
MALSQLKTEIVQAMIQLPMQELLAQADKHMNSHREAVEQEQWLYLWKQWYT